MSKTYSFLNKPSRPKTQSESEIIFNNLRVDYKTEINSPRKSKSNTLKLSKTKQAELIKNELIHLSTEQILKSLERSYKILYSGKLKNEKLTYDVAKEIILSRSLEEKTSSYQLEDSKIQFLRKTKINYEYSDRIKILEKELDEEKKNERNNNIAIAHKKHYMSAMQTHGN